MVVLNVPRGELGNRLVRENTWARRINYELAKVKTLCLQGKFEPHGDHVQSCPPKHHTATYYIDPATI